MVCMFKIYVWENLEKEVGNIEEATIFVNTLLCSDNDAAIRVTTEGDGKEKIVFKSKRYLAGDCVYLVLKAYAYKVCQICYGNGYCYNEYQQPSLCVQCKGEGNVKEELNRFKVVGPCTVEKIGDLKDVDEVDKNDLIIRNIVSSVSTQEAKKYIRSITNQYTSIHEQGNQTKFTGKKIFIVPLIKCFIDEQTAKEYAFSFNGLHRAREAAKRSFS